MKTTSQASAIFYSLSISTEGSFCLIIDCPDAESSTSDLFTINSLNSPKIEIISPTKTPSMNFEFEISVSLLDQNNQPYSVGNNIQIILNFNDTLIERQSLTITQSPISFLVTYKNFGYLQVTASISDSSISPHTKVIEVKKNLLVVNPTLIVNFI